MKNRLVVLALVVILFNFGFGSSAKAQSNWENKVLASTVTTTVATSTPTPKPSATPAPTASPTPVATPSPTPSATPNKAPSKKYLNLGADPQNPNRQPITGKEEVVVIDADICDPAWGTGSKKKIAGCYPTGSAIIRDIATGFVTAMYACGNEPSLKHKVSGKIAPTTTAAAIDRVVAKLGEMELKIGGSAEVHHTGAVKLEIVLPPAPSPTPTPIVKNDKGGHTNRNILLSTLGAGVIGGIVYAITKEDKHVLNGTTKDVTKCVTTSGKYTCK